MKDLYGLPEKNGYVFIGQDNQSIGWDHWRTSLDKHLMYLGDIVWDLDWKKEYLLPGEFFNVES